MVIRKERIAVGDPNKLKVTAPTAAGSGGTGGGECHRSFQGVHLNADRAMMLGQK